MTAFKPIPLALPVYAILLGKNEKWFFKRIFTDSEAELALTTFTVYPVRPVYPDLPFREAETAADADIKATASNAFIQELCEMLNCSEEEEKHVVMRMLARYIERQLKGYVINPAGICLGFQSYAYDRSEIADIQGWAHSSQQLYAWLLGANERENLSKSPNGPWKRTDDLSEPWPQWFEEMVQKLAKSYSS